MNQCGKFPYELCSFTEGFEENVNEKLTQIQDYVFPSKVIYSWPNFLGAFTELRYSIL